MIKITKEFLIGDLKKYMIENQLDIIEELQYGSLNVITDLIQMGNKCSEDEAIEKLEELLQEYELSEIVESLAYEVVGCEPSDDKETVNTNDYTSYLDILEDFYTELQVVDSNLSISEFNNLSTRYLYKYAEGVNKRYIFNKNKELRNNFDYIAMFMNALSGELKECPQYDTDGNIIKKSLIERLEADFGGGGNE